MRYYILERFNWHKPLCRETLLSKNACDGSMGVKWVQEIILMGGGGKGESCCCFRPRSRSFYSQLKKAVEPRKVLIMPRHYKKNHARPAAKQSASIINYYCSHIRWHIVQYY